MLQGSITGPLADILLHIVLHAQLENTQEWGLQHAQYAQRGRTQELELEDVHHALQEHIMHPLVETMLQCVLHAQLEHTQEQEQQGVHPAQGEHTLEQLEQEDAYHVLMEHTLLLLVQ